MVDDYACNFSFSSFKKKKKLETDVSHFHYHYFFFEGVEGTIPEDMASLLKASLGL